MWFADVVAPQDDDPKPEEKAVPNGAPGQVGSLKLSEWQVSDEWLIYYDPATGDRFAIRPTTSQHTYFDEAMIRTHGRRIPYHGTQPLTRGD